MAFKNPEAKGLPYEILEGILDGIKPRNKLLLIDACHSGEVDKEDVTLVASTEKQNSKITFRSANNLQVKQLGLENSFEIMKELFSDLRRGNGTTVISSAGGGEYAMESPVWKNGVFSYSFLSGLKEKKADLNRDGSIMLSEIQLYVQDHVSKLTQGKQRPTSRINNVDGDFRIH